MGDSGRLFDLMDREKLEDIFPNLKGTSYRITSPFDVDYNCIAWAAGDCQQNWWPDQAGSGYWPPVVEREENLTAFINAYKTLGYELCDNANVESGMEKIAIFVDADGRPTHASRQLSDGSWTSKLGKSVDISHTFQGLDGSVYGKVIQILSRTLDS